MEHLLLQSKRNDDNILPDRCFTPTKDTTMRYDDRITSVEMNNTNELLALLNEQDAKMENWIADVVVTATAIYDPTPEYEDQEWLDKGNY